jgi:putative flippase GtrA
VHLDVIPQAAASHHPVRAIERSLMGKLTRHACVSVGSMVVTQVLLLTFAVGAGWSGGMSNVAATTLTTIPAYVVNRRWVWALRHNERMLVDGLPFWISALIGGVCSTVAVAAVDARFHAPILLAATNIAVWGAIWLARFFFLEAMLARPSAVEQSAA